MSDITIEKKAPAKLMERIPWFWSDGPKAIIERKLCKVIINVETYEKGGKAVFWFEIPVVDDPKKHYVNLLKENKERGREFLQVLLGGRKIRVPQNLLKSSTDMVVDVHKFRRFIYKPDGRILRLERFDLGYESTGTIKCPPADVVIYTQIHRIEREFVVAGIIV